MQITEGRQGVWISLALPSRHPWASSCLPRVASLCPSPPQSFQSACRSSNAPGLSRHYSSGCPPSFGLASLTLTSLQARRCRAVGVTSVYPRTEPAAWPRAAAWYTFAGHTCINVKSNAGVHGWWHLHMHVCLRKWVRLKSSLDAAWPRAAAVPRMRPLF